MLILHARWNHEWDGEQRTFRRKFNRAAGFIRNTPIAGHADILIACVSDDRTGGTEDTIKKYEEMGKKDLILV